jgi:hypothetical protein
VDGIVTEFADIGHLPDELFRGGPMSEGVGLGNSGFSLPTPLYSNKQTFLVQVGTLAWCHKRPTLRLSSRGME